MSKVKSTQICQKLKALKYVRTLVEQYMSHQTVEQSMHHMIRYQ